jgi:predicted porin
MNRRLMAVAVAGALAAPGLALAQATTSGTNVQVYGLFDIRVDMDRFTGNPAGTIASLNKYNMHTGAPNRIGFRGTEALGGGLSAFFQVETQVFTDARQGTGNDNATNATLGGRPTFVGLRGGWGEIAFGYQDSVYKDIYAVWNVVPTLGHFGIIMGNGNSTGQVPSPNCNNLSAAGTNIVNASATAGGVCQETEGNGTSFNRTMSNATQYRTPVINGFRFSSMMAFAEGKEPTSSTPAGTSQYVGGFAAYSLTWAGGPFSAAAGLERHVGFGATNTALTDRNAKDTAWSLGARFNYGQGLLGVGMERITYGNTGVPGAENGFELKNWTAQATFNLTPSDVLGAGYSKTNGRENCGVALVSTGVTPTCGSGTGAKMYSLTLDHSFSKRTAIYGAYGKIDNNAGATYYYIAGPKSNSANGATGGLSAGVDVVTYQFGVKHSF